MGVRYWVGQEDEFAILDEDGRQSGKIKGCILTISNDKGDGRRYAMIDTGQEVRTIRLE